VGGFRKFAAVGFAVLGIGGLLSGCTNFDPESLDVFGLSQKTKLPGERRPVFPEGVPGVTQGVPPDLIKGRQPQPGTETAAVEQPAPAEQPKVESKPKPKPRVATRPSRVSVSPAAQRAPAENQAQQPQTQQTQTQQTGVNAPWPAPASQPPTSSPWPSAPAPGTFQR
jgi:hypothetical protein